MTHFEGWHIIFTERRYNRNGSCVLEVHRVCRPWQMPFTPQRSGRPPRREFGDRPRATHERPAAGHGADRSIWSIEARREPNEDHRQDHRLRAALDRGVRVSTRVERLLIPAGELEIGMVVDEPDHFGAITAICQLVKLSQYGELADGQWVIVYVDGKPWRHRPYRRVHVQPEGYEF